MTWQTWVVHPSCGGRSCRARVGRRGEGGGGARRGGGGVGARRGGGGVRTVIFRSRTAYQGPSCRLGGSLTREARLMFAHVDYHRRNPEDTTGITTPPYPRHMSGYGGNAPKLPSYREAKSTQTARFKMRVKIQDLRQKSSFHVLLATCSPRNMLLCVYYSL